MNCWRLLVGAHVEKARPSIVGVVLELLGQARAERPLVAWVFAPHSAAAFPHLVRLGCAHAYAVEYFQLVGNESFMPPLNIGGAFRRSLGAVFLGIDDDRNCRRLNQDRRFRLSLRLPGLEGVFTSFFAASAAALA